MPTHTPHRQKVFSGGIFSRTLQAMGSLTWAILAFTLYGLFSAWQSWGSNQALANAMLCFSATTVVFYALVARIRITRWPLGVR